MSDTSDSEMSDLMIESKSFEKLKEKMKTLGFQDGVAKGRDNTLQEGFNAGYSSGYRIGQLVGTHKGIIRCSKELGRSPITNLDEIQLEKLKNKACLLCSDYSEAFVSQENTINEVATQQQKYNSEIFDVLTNSILMKLPDK